ncbi:MAG: Spermidine/putrescine import ATP-binding protein PotA [Paracidovorax wautersii]|uniref:Spermidine/putrescine import ATP-binding protein PotA n=1 Tax=Paracidovorax wautersii TaxID=1177982 RepID=A0A7V8FPV0_9BURK|nr:MAG: Spermidine/putrescine import ATP-binding protein PotA [Paracidovorax wautersii]
MIELSAQEVCLNYGGNAVLKGVSMQLRRGEVVSLLGPSGSGKTTLLRAIAGLEQASDGRIAIGERVVYDGAGGIEVPAEERNLGLVFQSYALWPHKTVYDNVAYPLQLRRVARAEIARRVADVLGQLGLGHLGERFPFQLSGGQQQRVAIARALVYNPPVLLLDEPLSNLDAKLREEARAFLRELIVKLGLSALMVTHDQSEAMAMSDRILLLSNGRIEQEGTPQEMYGAPRTLFTAEFMGSNNRFEGRIAERRGELARLEGPGWSLWGRVFGPGEVGSAAVGVARVEQTVQRDQPGDNTLPAALQTSMYLGDRWECVYVAQGAGGHEGRIRAYSSGPAAPAGYQLHVPPEQLWIYPAAA